MNTRLIMTISAFVMGAVGICFSFLPQEILQYLSVDSSQVYSLIVQIVGALYFAFAMLNWTAKENLIGGIYGRPIVIGNLTHFLVGALALLKGAAQLNVLIVWIAAIIYSLFAVLFTVIFFKHPTAKEK